MKFKLKPYIYTPSEASIQRSILEYLRAKNIQASPTDASRTFGPDGRPRKSKVEEGWPDISAVLPPNGRFWAIEVKSAKGRLRPAQKAVLELLEKNGAVVTVARSVEDVAVVLIRLENGLLPEGRE